ncbi:MAG: V-type ATP synthase subunit A, partial [Clostridiales bacterium]|nr:V-type ATP synthase subunit A [Clostridiales bacterium]
MSKNVIFGINGPVVTVAGARDFSMQEMVYVGKEKLVGEVIGVNESFTTIQVYEVTTGLRPGEPVEPTGSPMSVTLGPGILSNIFDGIERPLRDIADKDGAFIGRGSDVEPLDTKRLWDVTLTVKVGDELKPGDIYAECPETPSIVHKVMVPPGISGKVTFAVKNGSYSIHDRIAELEDAKGNKFPLTLCQKWPIRNPRPFAERLACTVPLITGQRIIDTMLPIAKGGTAAIPGGFGTGKTMTQH